MESPRTVPEPPAPPSEARQRWRLAYRRRADAPHLAQREQLAAWEASLAASGLPLAGLDLPAPRPRVVLGAPLAVGMPAEHEIADIFLVERRAVAEVRALLAASLPPGHELVDLHDVWLGEPPLPGRVAAADYRVELEASGEPSAQRDRLASACERLLASSALPRTRDKGGRAIGYDLRPLVAGAAVLPGAGPLVSLRVRTRFDPERGVGRPDEVLAALSELAGMPLEARSIVRERVLLAGET
jgi:radical SAM-linked protein